MNCTIQNTFVTAVAYDFGLNLPRAFSQPGKHSFPFFPPSAQISFALHMAQCKGTVSCKKRRVAFAQPLFSNLI